MQSAIRFIVTGLIILGIIGFMTTYTVKFTETAVVTTFGRADERSIVTEPGLRFKLPYPIQVVTRYDTRVRFVESRPETQQTADNRQIILTTYVTYRVTNPLAFYKLFSKAGNSPSKHYEAAEAILTSRLRNAMSQTAKFRFDELFSQMGGGKGLLALEAKIQDQLSTDDTGRKIEEFGLEVVSVGISGTKLPEETTRAVAARMQQTRKSLAQEAISRGQAETTKIMAEAQGDAAKIMGFADRRARAIQATGELEAKKYVERQNVDPQLAVFLKQMDMMRDAMARKFTLVLPVSMSGMDVFSPNAMQDFSAGRIKPLKSESKPETKPEAGKGAGK